MKICIISKYPPVEGGVSSEVYWMAKLLGERGHKIYVVTNAWEVEKDYREHILEDELSFLEPKNVHVYSTVKDFKPPILNSNYYTEKLIGLATDVIRSKDADIIYSNYVIPYGIVGFIVKQITGKPHILRHAGSDVGRLYFSKFFKTAFVEAFKDADKIIGGNNIYQIFQENGISQDKIVGTMWSVDTEHFNPNVKPFDLSPYIKNLDYPVFSYFGKVSTIKKTYAFVNAASKIKGKKFTLLFVAGEGDRVEELKKHVKGIGLEDKCIFLPFQPPWKIPSIMRASTCVVSPENEETPILKKGSHYPKIVREAMACGKCAILGEGVSKKGVYTALSDKENVLIVNPQDIEGFKEKLEFVIDNPQAAEDIGKNAYKVSKENEDLARYVNYTEELLYSVIKN